jgi:hypothetical protein
MIIINGFDTFFRVILHAVDLATDRVGFHQLIVVSS